MFQNNFALHFQFLSRGLFVYIFVLVILSALVAFVFTRGSHIPVSAGVSSVKVL